MGESPPKEKDYSDDIIQLMSSGLNNKSSIMSELNIDEGTWDSTILKLKQANLIRYQGKIWVLK